MPAQRTALCNSHPFWHFRPLPTGRTIEMNENLHSKQCYQRSVCQTEENCFLPSSLKWLSKHLSISRQLGREEKPQKVCGGGERSFSILLYIQDRHLLIWLVPCLFFGALRSLFQSSRQFERWYLICRWKETSEPINGLEELLWIFLRFSVPSRPFLMFSSAHDWIMIPKLAFKEKLLRSKLFQSMSLVGLRKCSAIVCLTCDFYAHTFDSRQKNCKFMSSNLTLVPTNFSFLFVVLCPIKISLWHISLHRRRRRMTNNLFGLAFFAQCERLSLG